MGYNELIEVMSHWMAISKHLDELKANMSKIGMLNQNWLVSDFQEKMRDRLPMGVFESKNETNT